MRQAHDADHCHAGFPVELVHVAGDEDRHGVATMVGRITLAWCRRRSAGPTVLTSPPDGP